MAGKVKVITGERFSKLSVIGFNGMKPAGKYSRATWMCKCDCGKNTVVSGSDLRSGNTKSCGCYIAEKASVTSRKHGQARDGRQSGAYRSYSSMMQRCHYPKSINYANYGGRGISVCDKWRNNFKAFYEDMGDRPELYSLDRIDPDKSYSPDNCRWIPNRDQAKNQRRTVWVSVDGVKMIQSEASRFLNVTNDMIASWRKNPERVPSGIDFKELTS